MWVVPRPDGLKQEEQAMEIKHFSSLHVPALTGFGDGLCLIGTMLFHQSSSDPN